jgi:hypothetical protein
MGDLNMADDRVHWPAIMSCQGSGVRVGATPALWYSYMVLDQKASAPIYILLLTHSRILNTTLYSMLAILI